MTAKALGIGIVVLVGVMVGIQWIPVETDPVASDTSAAARPPKNVEDIMVRACFDCHSDQFRIPWYGKVAPVSWLVVHDINEGREHLNFVRWNSYPAERRAKLIKESIEEVEEGKMPLASYEVLHPEARLTEGERQQLVAWFRAEVR